MIRRALLTLALSVLPLSRALAQGILLDASVATGGEQDLSVYRAGMFGRLGGAFEGQIHGVLLRTLEGGAAQRWGAGIELAAWRGGRAGPYLAGSLDGGFTTRDAQDFWGSWSAGLGYELQPFDFFSLSAETRWREVSGTGRGGMQFGLAAGLRWGRARRSTPEPLPVASTAPAAPPEPAPASTPSSNSPAAAPPLSTPATANRGQLLANIIATARQEMGRRYQYGGQGQGEQGFDCSGLIQYSYRAHGIALPRTSREQAGQGTAVERSLASLEPGDLLTFTTQGSRVSHVGLYMGEGKFIHSASSGGVQESVLSPDDPYGAWWYKRWIGVRRIVP